MNKVIVEGDNNEVIKAMSNTNKVPWCIDSIVSDVGKEVADFSEIYFWHIGREVNRVTDFMAAKSHHYNSPTRFFLPYDIDFSLLV